MKIYSFHYEKRKENSDKEIIFAVRAYLCNEKLQISVMRDEYGKPHIIGDENVFVSVTHAENLLLVAVSEKEIGIDAERCDRHVRNFRSLSERYFTREETDFLGDDFTKEDFLDMWVKKEALSKLLGGGVPCMKSMSVFDGRISFSKHSEYDGFIVYSVTFNKQ